MMKMIVLLLKKVITMYKNKLPLVFGVIFLLQACAPTLPVRNSDLILPNEFPFRPINNPKGGTSAEVTWQKFFHDPDLATLVNIALKNNQELGILEQEINIANNEIMSRQGEYLPKFKAFGSGGVEKVERFSSEDANSPTRFDRGGVMMSWELDIWKKLRNASKSAYLTYLASIEGRHYVVTNLVAEVASTYFELMALDNQMEIVDSYIAILTRIKSMVDLQLAAARVTSLAVRRFEAEVLKNQSRKYKILQNITITENKLNRLLGRFPQPIVRNSKEFSTYMFAKMKSSVPVKLMDNRPDIKRAVFDLEASKLNVDVARARFYPSLSIDADAGYESFNSKHFRGGVDPASNFYSLVGNISMPILNRKAIKAEYFSADNRQVQAILHYEQTLIKAYTEVANQLTKVKNLNIIYDLKMKQVNALTQAIEISNTLFRAARVDYIEALFTQRDALEAQVELVDVKRQQLNASVDLYKALGGGWKGLNEKYESNY
jgi:multidrug efflux system outer membrane protein